MQSKEWLLAEAKNKLTEVINMALLAPQIIKRRQDTVVVISNEEYHRLIGAEISFKTHLLSAPYTLAEIDFERDKSEMRAIEL